ncbi:rhomboid family protein [Hymenobacter canadensis]|uniref:Rhomboid family intramembrane serine protease n=1 Tax=Hymenobacter canadensis TaxID=2999067 RepID=A0ABY7LNH4_9BACT|nr:rhomboid family intramembrane serine protease [Hymenobacter canadensis]WBA40448.1 rhomboid family intramembrane serine protease [Hymenobacter canadensis]
MSDLGVIGLIIALVTAIVSYQGLKDTRYFHQYSFEVGAIRSQRQYYRLLTSGFLHTSWLHLILNLFTIWCFGGILEQVLGMRSFLALYLLSMLGGNLFSLWLHRHEPQYTAVGASGGMSGLIFAGIALFPGIEVGMVGLYLPGWLYGLLYVLIAAYGVTTRTSNIGHDAHLVGALTGLLAAIGMVPGALLTNYWVILALAVPALAFLVLLICRPAAYLQGNLLARPTRLQTVDDRFHGRRKQQQVALDELLEKVHSEGLASLSKQELQQLKELSSW